MRQFRSILVPLDGSTFSEQALPMAVDLACRAGAIIQVVQVHQPLPTWAMSLEVPQIDPALDQEARQREEAYLRGVAERIKAEHHLPVTAALLDGPVAATLAEHAGATSADLVIMTTHGRGAFSRFWLGSVADHLVRRLTVPAILIRPHDGAGAPTLPPRRILIALDRSAFSEAILDPAISLGHLTTADFTLLTVVEPVLPLVEPPIGAPLVVDDTLNEQLRQSAERYIEAVAGRVSAEGCRVSTRVVSAPGAARTILDQCSGDAFDLIALATHGERGVRRAVLGSVADKVVRGSTHPVLVFRPAEGAKD